MALFCFLPLSNKENSVSKTFKKSEHLKSLSLIKQIFGQGQTVKQFPIRAVYIPLGKEFKSTQIALSVPKKKFKNAVDRNRIKRQMREAYRLNRDEVLTDLQQHFGIVFIYLSNQHSDFTVIQKGMVQCMAEIARISAMNDWWIDERKLNTHKWKSLANAQSA